MCDSSTDTIPAFPIRLISKTAEDRSWVPLKLSILGSSTLAESTSIMSPFGSTGGWI